MQMPNEYSSRYVRVTNLTNNKWPWRGIRTARSAVFATDTKRSTGTRKRTRNTTDIFRDACAGSWSNLVAGRSIGDELLVS